MVEAELSADRRAGLRDQVIAGTCVVGCGGVLGLNFALLKVALRAAGPITVQALATVLTGAILAAYLFAKRSRYRVSPRELGWTATAGLLLGVCGSCATAFGVERIAAGTAALILATTPVLTVLVRAGLFRQRPRRAEVGGCALGLVGVVIVVWGSSKAGHGELIGGLLVLLAALLWALALIVMRERLARVPPDVVVAWELIVSSPVLLVIAYTSEGVNVRWSLAFLGAVVYLGLAGKGLSFLLQMIAVRRGSDVLASATAFLTPPFGVFFGAVLLAEHVGALEVLGALVILAGVAAIISAGPPRNSVVGRSPGGT